MADAPSASDQLPHDRTAAERPLRARLIPGWRDAIWVDAILPTIALRAVLLLAGWLFVVVLRPDALPTGDPLAIWNRWDGPHFLEIARYGYGPPADPARIVLFPLFPALVAAGSLIASPLVAAMAISFIATVAAAAGLYRLTRMDHGRGTARAAVLAMNVFPTAYAFVAPYSEAPFLALVVWSLVAARREKWPAAGIFALLAAATRLQGVFLVPALAFEFVLVHRRLGREMAWIGLGLGGLLIYLWLNLATFGDALHFVAVQRTVFHVETVAPWQAFPGLIGGVIAAAGGEFWFMTYVAPLVAYLVLAAATGWAVLSRCSRPSYAIYAVLNLVTLATLSWPISMPRYLLGVAPIFIWLGVIGRRSVLGQAVLVTSVLLLGLFMSRFVIGHWAF